MATQLEDQPDHWRHGFDRVVAYVGPLVLILPIVFGTYVYSTNATDRFFDFMSKNYALFFGVSFAAVFSFYLVIAL